MRRILGEIKSGLLDSTFLCQAHLAQSFFSGSLSAVSSVDRPLTKA